MNLGIPFKGNHQFDGLNRGHSTFLIPSSRTDRMMRNLKAPPNTPQKPGTHPNVGIKLWGPLTPYAEPTNEAFGPTSPGAFFFAGPPVVKLITQPGPELWELWILARSRARGRWRPWTPFDASTVEVPKTPGAMS